MRVEPNGPLDATLAIFGEKPGYEEQEQGQCFVGKAGTELWAGLARFCGLTRDDCYVSNIVKWGSKKDPKPLEIAMALPEFLDELATLTARVIVTAGSISTRAMLGPVKLSDVHGIPHTAEICGQTYTVLPMYHPIVGLANKGFLAVVAYDLGRLGALLRGDIQPWAPAALPGETKWLTPAAMRSCDRFPAASVAGLDTEGWADAPKMLSFTPDGRVGYVIKSTDEIGLAWFFRWITGRTVVMHNGIHDVPVLRAMGGEIGRFHDTQVLGYHDSLRTGSGALESESQNLGTLAYRECGLQLGELTDCAGVDFETQTIPNTDEVMHYAGMDPIATWRLFHVYKDRGLLDYPPYQIDMGQVPLVEQMIANGLPFDMSKTMDFYSDVLGKIEDVTATLKAKAARFGNRDFNPRSHPQVRELITRKIGLRIRKRTRGGKASTNEKALADHRDHPFVEQLQTFRELDKLKGTYLEPLLEELQ